MNKGAHVKKTLDKMRTRGRIQKGKKNEKMIARKVPNGRKKKKWKNGKKVQCLC